MNHADKGWETRVRTQEMQDAVAMGMQGALTRDEIVAEMYRNGKKILEIEIEMQLSPQTIYRALARQGVPLRRGRNKPTVWDYVQALEFVVGEETARKVQEQVGWTP